MIWWVLILAGVAILSYLSDVGVLSFMQDLKVPFFNASLTSVLVLLCMIGVLARMRLKAKGGKTEILADRILELEKELKTSQEKGSD
jgi:hypothetical protein